MNIVLMLYHLGYINLYMTLRIWPLLKHDKEPDPSVFVVLVLIFTMLLTLKSFSLDLATGSAFRPINYS